jgi:exopolysaccharide biosynthesis polyprenyl glycosylphosphotransferase
LTAVPDVSVSQLAEEIRVNRRDGVRAGSRGKLVSRTLLLSDSIAIATAFLATQGVAALAGDGPPPLATLAGWLGISLAVSVWLVLTRLYGLNRNDAQRVAHSTVDEAGSILLLLTVVCWVLFAGAFFTGVGDAVSGELLLFWVLAVPAVILARAFGRAYCRRRASFLQNTVIIGTGSSARRVARILLRHRDYGVNLLGFVATADVPHGLDAGVAFPSTDELLRQAPIVGVERAIVTAPGISRQMSSLVRRLSRLGVNVDVIPDVYDCLGPDASVHFVEGIAVLGLPRAARAWRPNWVKRAIDLSLAVIAMLVLAPLFALTALAVRLDSRGPVLFRHRRMGIGGRPIEVLKFRTMHADYCVGPRYGGGTAEQELQRLMMDAERAKEFRECRKFSNDPRVTRIGGFLRKTSLDELPQLANVLRGDLSLVGPRPITEEELSRYGEHADELLSVRPGVTGYWQINGRSSLDYDERIRLDLAYVSGRSLTLDWAILAKTVRVVLARGGAV